VTMIKENPIMDIILRWDLHSYSWFHLTPMLAARAMAFNNEFGLRNTLRLQNL